MNSSGWIQLALFVVALAAITKPMGLYLMRVLDANGKTWLDPVLKPFERLTYRSARRGRGKEHDWKQYTFAMLLFSLVSCVFTYAILRLQHLLPLNPQGLGPLSPHLAFNTAVSFTTNTNWQSYGGESTMSYFSQMVALTFTTLSPPPSASASPPRSCVASPAHGEDTRQLLGRPRPRHLLPARCRSASCSQSSSCRRA
jgi:K+-transporting ATPase ATPase A chain